MNEPSTESRRTRESLVAGLQSGSEEGWAEFFVLYAPMIRRFALRAGCSESESDEVVQETAIAVARHLPEYRYEPGRCRFKTWLMNQASWRIKDQLRTRRRWDDRVHPVASRGRTDDDASRTDTIERIEGEPGDTLDRLWDLEWREGLVAAALVEVKERCSDRNFQVFDLSVSKAWPASEVARSLGISLPTVYLVKHRVSALLKRTVTRLEKAAERKLVVSAPSRGRDDKPSEPGAHPPDVENHTRTKP